MQQLFVQKGCMRLLSLPVWEEWIEISRCFSAANSVFFLFYQQFFDLIQHKKEILFKPRQFVGLLKIHTRHVQTPVANHPHLLPQSIDSFQQAVAKLIDDHGANEQNRQKDSKGRPVHGMGGYPVGILPYTLRHNGKAEHSHHNSLERVYNHLCVYSCIDLRLQMKKYFRRSKRSSMEVFGWKSPIQRALFEW